MTPKISVITISYNNKEGLEKTIQSVISQDFPDKEYIVIDGGSNDGTKEVLQKYSDKINFWVSEPDKGIYNAMNKGIAATTGEYLIFLNSGDTFISNMVLSASGKQLGTDDFIYGNLELSDNKHAWIKSYPEKLNLLHFFQSSLPHPATFIRKSAFDKFGMYDEDLKIVSDWKWFMIAVCKYKSSYKHLNFTISTFYQDGISSNPENIKKIEYEIEHVLETEFPESIEIRKEIIRQNKEIKKLKNFEYKFNYLKKYRLVRLLALIGLIKIP